MQYIRKGSCPPERCQGQCCKKLAFFLKGYLPDEAVDFFKLRGVRVITDSETVELMFDMTCPKLTEDNLCSIYEERPDTCRIFPAEPRHIREIDCGFYFEAVNG